MPQRMRGQTVFHLVENDAGVPPPSIANGRFLLPECLQEEDYFATWRGTDASTGAAIIAKTVTAVGLQPERVRRVERDCLLLQQTSLLAREALAWGRGAQGGCYLVRQEIPGETLAERLQRGALTVKEVLETGVALLTTLQQAHHVGVLHRSIKPTNIILPPATGTLDATLVDFCDIRSVTPQTAVASAAWLSALAYMAPEQSGALNREVGPVQICTHSAAYCTSACRAKAYLRGKTSATSCAST